MLRASLRCMGMGALLALPLMSTGCQKKSKDPSQEPVAIEAPQPIQRNWKMISRNTWYAQHPRIDHWKKHYDKTRDPWVLWKKAHLYLPTIQKVFAEHQLPNELCLLPLIESSFNPRARSERAAGLWQFVVPTAKDMGLIVNSKLDERLNWQRSTHAAAKYLTFLAKKFNGNWGLVLAAYNMGPGAIERACVEQNTQDFWQLQVRDETTQYVPKFLAMIQLLRESYPDS